MNQELKEPDDAVFGYCLNTSTIRRPGLTAMDALEVAAQAGYDGIEPWIRELDAYVASGGSLEAYRKKAQDLGLHIVNVIAFIEWFISAICCSKGGKVSRPFPWEALRPASPRGSREDSYSGSPSHGSLPVQGRLREGISRDRSLRRSSAARARQRPPAAPPDG